MAETPESAVATGLVTLDEIEAAAARLRGVIRRTPLIPTELEPGRDLWLKCENFQRVSAFKARGAYNFVSLLPDEERLAGLVTYSSGNHAQAVAFAARAFGVRAKIVMPVDAPKVKLDATRALGADVEQVGTTSAERQERAEQIVRESGGVMVPPFDDARIIEGQGTVGLELVEQLADAARRVSGEEVAPGLVLVPIGGGGLISGTAAAVRALVPEAKVVGVEPEGAAAMKRSLEAGRPTTLDRVDTVADGLKPVRPGDLTFAHCRSLVERVVTVSDAAIREAVVWLFGRRLVVEPSGAASVAAVLSGRVEPGERGPTVAILSGGNIEPGLLARWFSA